MSADTPECLRCWMSDDEKEPQRERERWMNRPTFILAAVGSAIGLGNFWRFPYLTYRYDGAYFFFPYIMCLVCMGIPLLLMELGLGQKFQRGDISVFRGIHRRLSGIGLASVFSAYIITFYYNVIISYSLVYFVAGFISPLPWSSAKKDFVPRCDMQTTTRAEQFFNIDVIRFFNDDCESFEDGDDSQFSVYAFIATFFVWASIYLAVFKGVKSASWIVWLTVPVPAVLILIMVFNGLQLEGHKEGVRQYLQGTPDDHFASPEDIAALTARREKVWGDAAGQIFFSIGVCMGIMTSYGSYNDVKKPIIMDNLIICLSNSMLSFVSGFAVWSVVGYLQAQDSLAKSKTSSMGLAFIAYPSAIDTMEAPNFWAVLFGLTLYMLGIDSAFSMVEATSTVICDTPTGKKYPRMFVAFALCLLGFMFSVPFCTNWGFVLFDTIDHYLCVYLLLLVGILQCFGCGWGFDAPDTMEKSDVHRTSLWVLSGTFWFILIIVGAVFVALEQVPLGILILVVCLLFLSLLPSFYFGRSLGFWGWYNDIAMCGVRKLGYSMSMLGRDDPTKRLWYEPLFVFYWGFTIKYLVPCVLWLILCGSVKGDLANPYGDYAMHWQIIGMLVPLVGLIAFLLSICFNNYEEPYDRSVFENQAEASSGKVHNKDGDGGMVHMVDVGGKSGGGFEESEMRKIAPVPLSEAKGEGSVNNMNVPVERE